jgi:hypothetical protein
MSVLSKTALKAAIDAAITTNSTNSITGAQLNSILNNVADSYQDTLPQLTTAQILALTPTLNQLVFNTDRNFIMQYNGTTWVFLVAMFIGTTIEVNAAANKAGQIYFDTDTNSYFLGAPSGKSPVLVGDCACMKTVKVSLSSAQILSSNTTPIELIAAPGAGKAILIRDVAVQVISANNGYSTNTDGIIVYTQAPTVNILKTPIDLTHTLDYPIFKHITDDVSEFYDNDPVFFSTATGDPTTGDGDFVLHLTYQIITL